MLKMLKPAKEPAKGKNPFKINNAKGAKKLLKLKNVISRNGKY